MRTINFFTTANGKKPVEELSSVPTEYFKKLQNTDWIWEVRAAHGSNASRYSASLTPEIW